MFCWFKKLPKSTPLPEGPYVTGCAEVMSEYSKDSIFIRILYPTDATQEDLRKKTNKWVPWIPDDIYIKAIATLLHLWFVLLKVVMWMFGNKTYIPTLSEEPLTDRIEKLPVFIVSHGYGANRFLYSTVCNELASRGYLVVCLEHKDKSASITYYYESESDMKKDRRSLVKNEPFPFRTSPPGQHYLFRNAQLKKRSLECSDTLNLLHTINDGNFENKLKSKFDIRSLKGRIDLTQPSLLGHSFGGATVLYTLATDKRFKFGVVLDGWMFPLKSEACYNLSQPCLFINSHTFQIENNVNMMRKFTDLPQNTLYTIRNTTHESNSDTPIVFGYWLNIFMKKLDAVTALKIQNYLILDFLHKQHRLPIDQEEVDNYLTYQHKYIVKDYLIYARHSVRKFTVF